MEHHRQLLSDHQRRSVMVMQLQLRPHLPPVCSTIRWNVYSVYHRRISRLLVEVDHSSKYRRHHQHISDGSRTGIDNSSLVVSMEINGVMYQGVLFALNGVVQQNGTTTVGSGVNSSMRLSGSSSM
jgi:hypothetical protein